MKKDFGDLWNWATDNLSEILKDSPSVWEKFNPFGKDSFEKENKDILDSLTNFKDLFKK